MTMKRTLLGRLADRMILCPTTHSIPVEGKQRRWVPFADGRLEIWSQRVGPARDQPDVLVLKFPGVAGRAERSSDAPGKWWLGLSVEQWTVNPPGYGASTGPASLRQMPAMAEAAFDAIRRHAPGRPIVVAGNSLGGLSALYLACRRPVDGLILRNAPPLAEVIVARHRWWTLGFGARWIASQVPEELGCVQNARGATAPLVYVMSGADRVVPAAYQQSIIDAHAGPKRVIVLRDADHATQMTDEQAAEYQQALAWLWTHVASGQAVGGSHV